MTTSTLYNQQGNGRAEAANEKILSTFKKHVSSKKNSGHQNFQESYWHVAQPPINQNNKIHFL